MSSDLQFPPIAVRDWRGKSDSVFYSEVFSGLGRYDIAERIEAWPRGMKPILRYGPHDIRYANPVIVVSQRADF